MHGVELMLSFLVLALFQGSTSSTPHVPLLTKQPRILHVLHVRQYWSLQMISLCLGGVSCICGADDEACLLFYKHFRIDIATLQPLNSTTGSHSTRTHLPCYTTVRTSRASDTDQPHESTSEVARSQPGYAVCAMGCEARHDRCAADWAITLTTEVGNANGRESRA